VADGGSGPEAQTAGLYRLPLEEFTPARNQLAQQLRRAGEPELGEQVKRLRKPSVAAWTLNQLRRRQPELVDGLIDAGLRLREAQERLLDDGERERLREAAADERQLVEEAVQAAEAILRIAGQTVSASLHNKLWETTHAAAVDPELGETLRRGRLFEDRQISDLGLIGGLGSASGSAAAAASGPGKPAPAKATQRARRQLEQARKRKQKLEERLQTALRAAGEAESQLAHTHETLQNAETAAARALAGAERAHAAVEQAREQAQEAADRLGVLEAHE
jgi:chemotaxis protein histidine kinase CheA